MPGAPGAMHEARHLARQYHPHMNPFALRSVRRPAAIAAAALVLLAVAAALALRGAGAWLRTAAEETLQARLVPRVHIAEPAVLSLLPQPALTLRKVSLHGASGETPLTVREATLLLDPSALWRGEIAVAALSVSGMELTLRRDATGWNAAQWLRPGTDDAGGAAPPIGRVVFEDARIRVAGDFAAQVELTRLAAGPFFPGASGTLELAARLVGDAAALELAADARYRLDTDGVSIDTAQLTAGGRFAQWRLNAARVRLDALRLGPDGALQAGAATVTLTAAAPATTVELAARLAQFAADGTRWRGTELALTLDAGHEGHRLGARLASPAAEGDADSWRLPQVTIGLATQSPSPALTLEIAGELAGAMTADEPSLRLAIERAHARLPHPAGGTAPLALSFAGAARIDPVRRVADGTLSGAFDDSRFDGTWQFDAAAAPPLALTASLDRIDLDRYLPPPAADPAPADLAAWRNWPVAAELRIGRLRVGGFTSDNARLRLSGGPSVTGAR